MPSYSETFSSSRSVKKALNASDGFFKYCEFLSASLEGGHFDGVYVSCSFKEIDCTGDFLIVPCLWIAGLSIARSVELRSQRAALLTALSKIAIS